MKDWIEKNLFTNNGRLIPKRLKKEWFINNGFEKEYNNILDITEFLGRSNDKLIQRMWHICNNSFKIHLCECDGCNNKTNFKSFLYGYYKNCSDRCAQKNKETIQKIKLTNINKYGKEYYIQTDNFKEKSKKTNLKKYGVDNVSKLEDIKQKKKSTCLKNHGVEYILSNQKLKEDCVYKKYGVKNVQQVESIKNRRIETRRSQYYDCMIVSDRLKGMATPLFSKEEYVKGGHLIKYKFKCSKCFKDFDDCLEDGDLPRCPSCYANNSLFQSDVYTFLKSIYNDTILSNDRKICDGLELDFYIPALKIAIECDGNYWHSELRGGKDKKYHLHKTELCEKQGIRLIHIFEDEWMLKQNIVKNKLKHLLLYKESVIYARNCDIKEINRKDADKFLLKYHIQGIDKSSIRLGLFNNNKLVMVATFGKLRMVLGNKNATINNEYELYRLCSSVNVVGGASKLIQYFIKTHKPSKIISYADRRYSSNQTSFYNKIGFKFVKYTQPNYWYTGKNSNYKKWHRFSFAKHKLLKKLKNFDANLSEWENMKNNGWDRIWDCGNLLYEMNL